MRAAFFDMDRTLVRVNTASLYVRWQFRNGEVRRRDVARVLYWIGRYTLGIVDAEAIARDAARAVTGLDEPAFRAKIEGWVDRDVIPHVMDGARREVERKRREGYVCAILSSATTYAVGPIAETLGIEHVLATQLGVAGGKLTGEIDSLCYGPTKVARARSWAEQLDVDVPASAFYTDSISDLPMLEHVREPVVVNPDPRLRWVAFRRNWRVERW